jgi:hypothetical protein
MRASWFETALIRWEYRVVMLSKNRAGEVHGSDSREW